MIYGNQNELFYVTANRYYSADLFYVKVVLSTVSGAKIRRKFAEKLCSKNPYFLFA